MFLAQVIVCHELEKCWVTLSHDIVTSLIVRLQSSSSVCTHFRDTAKKLSRKFMDRPLSAADTAIYWVEYIIRHGANALRSPAMDLTWWQVELLDVGAFILIAIIAALYVIMTVIQFMFNLTFSNSNSNDLRKKKIS